MLSCHVQDSYVAFPVGLALLLGHRQSLHRRGEETLRLDISDVDQITVLCSSQKVCKCKVSPLPHCDASNDNTRAKTSKSRPTGGSEVSLTMKVENCQHCRRFRHPSSTHRASSPTTLKTCAALLKRCR